MPDKLKVGATYIICLTYKDGKRGIFPTESVFQKFGKNDRGEKIALFKVGGSTVSTGFPVSHLINLIKKP
jgi:hypothetical protein